MSGQEAGAKLSTVGSDDGELVVSLSGIDAGYGNTIVLRSVSLQVHAGSVVALLGANGAGKTTTLRVAAGLIRPRRGAVTVDGIDMTRSPAHARAKAGICLIPEGRGIFRSLTVRDNLELQVPPWMRSQSIAPALAAFPVLESRLGQVAGSLSGGEQQMLAMSRAYLSKPRVVLLDEVSMGLAPVIVDQVFKTMRDLAQRHVALVVVEQYVNRALELADRVVLLRRGEIAWEGNASDLDERALAESYLGQERELSSHPGSAPGKRAPS
jgi:branched-chain amino acid transport system ATP-binding protein